MKKTRGQKSRVRVPWDISMFCQDWEFRAMKIQALFIWAMRKLQDE
jgi:hypothetical protein